MNSPSGPIRVTVWNEYRHERDDAAVGAIYPEGIHGAIASFLSRDADLLPHTATLDEPEHGLTEEVLAETDVLLWWGHKAHEEVNDEVVSRVQRHVLEGMGLIVLHSGHYSKIFKRLMGTTCSLSWRNAGDRERVWNLAPAHPITQGVGPYFELEDHEMYGEPFGIPHPEELLFVSWYSGGEVFRSGCTWKRGHGKIFYFSPGHETQPIYHHPQVQQVITNAVHWARPLVRIPDTNPNPAPLEKL